MIIEVIVCSIVIGLLRGGKAQNLLNISIRGFWLVVAGLLLRMTLTFFSSQYGLIDLVYIIGQGLGFFLVVLGFCLNGKFLCIAAGGILLNILVIMLNGGLMPVSKGALKVLRQGFSPDDLVTAEARYILIDKATRLPFLGDIFAVPSIYPSYRIFSIGDIILYIGVFFFLQHILLNISGGNDKQ